MNAREIRKNYVFEKPGLETRVGLASTTLNGNEQSRHHSQDCE